MIRVVIVARYSEVREGLCMVLRLAGGVEIIGAADRLSRALDPNCATCPDIVLVDLEMPEGEGYQTIRQVKRLYPGIKAVALTSHDYPEARESAVRAGASLVLVKGMGLQEMVAAIQAAAGAQEDHP